MRSALKPDPPSSTPYRDEPDAEIDDDGDLERQQQSLMFEEQDRTLGSIAGVIGTLREQASVMGREVFEQVGCVGMCAKELTP